MSDEPLIADVEFSLPAVLFAAGDAKDGGEGGRSSRYVGFAKAVAAGAIIDLNAEFLTAGASDPLTAIRAGEACEITIQARGGDLFLRRKHIDDVSATGTTNGDASNGFKIFNGQDRSFRLFFPWTKLDVNVSGALTAFIWRSNPIR